MQTAVGVVAPQVRDPSLRNALRLRPGEVLRDRRGVLLCHPGVVAGLQLVPARRLGPGGGLADILGWRRGGEALGRRRCGPLGRVGSALGYDPHPIAVLAEDHLGFRNVKALGAECGKLAIVG
jgi:hypothetical protein